MYRRSRFLDALIAIRQEMARDADYDVDLFVERARSGKSGVGTFKLKDEAPRASANRSVSSRDRSGADEE